MSNDARSYKFEARNPKSETFPNDRNERPSPQIATKLVLVIFFLNI